MIKTFLYNKKLQVLTLSLMACTGVLASAIPQEQDEIEKKIKGIKISIREIDRGIESDYRNLSLSNQGFNEIVIALGLTGAGKSTLMNFMAGKTATGAKGHGSNVIDISDPVPGMEVGHNIMSKTIAPAYWRSNGVVYYDSPGFADTGNHDTSKEECEIRNAYTIHKLLETYRDSRIKILMALKEDAINARSAGDFDNHFKIIGKLFRGNPVNSARGTCLIITGQNGFDKTDEVREKIRNLYQLRTHRSDFDTAALEYLDELIEKSSIEFFPSPEKKECVNNLELNGEEWQQARTKIMTALENTQSIEGGLSPALTVSDTTEEMIRQLATRIGIKTKNFISDNIAKQISAFCKSCYEDEDAIKTDNDLNVLRSFYKIIEEKISDINTDNINNFSENMDDLFFITGIDRKILSDPIRYIKFFQKVVSDSNNPVQFPLQSWKEALDPVKQHIKLLGQKPEEPEDFSNGEVLQLQGFLLGTSDIRKNLKGRNPKKIVLFGFNRIWFNEDITRPETSLSVIAPDWVMRSSTTINLSGNNNNSKANNGHNPGGDGQPGAPGGSGGHFYGKVANFNRIGTLTINVNGGHGGEGGNGARGQNGNDGHAGNIHMFTAGNLPNLTYVNTSGFPRRHPVGAYEVYKDNDHWEIMTTHHDCASVSGTATVYEHGDNNATFGHNGGNRGAGGKGGKSGDVIMEYLHGTQNHGCSISREDGASGRAGESGAGGDGGWNGPVLRGTYYTGLTGSYAHVVKRTIWKDVYDWACRQGDYWSPITVVTPRLQARSGAQGNGINTHMQLSPLVQPALDPDLLKETYFTLYNQQDGNNPFLGKWQ